MKRVCNILTLCIGVVALAACHLNKEAAGTVEVEVPAEFEIPDSFAQSLDSSLISRDVFFKDTSLIHLIEDALQYNFDLTAFNKEAEINRELFQQAKSAFYPQIDLNLFSIEKRWFSEASRNTPNDLLYEHAGKTTPSYLFRERSDFYSNLALSWEVDIWGKLRNQKKKAGALYHRSQLVRRVLQTELVATVSDDYYTLLMLEEQLDVAVKNYQFRDSTLTMINLLYNAGEVSALAVQQAKTQVLEAVSLISELKEKRDIKENNLRLLTGKLPSEIRRRYHLSVEDTTYKEVESLPLFLVQNRPDVLAAQYSLEAANAQVGISRAQRYPSLTISAAGGLESLLSENLFQVPGALFGNFLGGLTEPLFRHRKLKTDFYIARLKREEERIHFQRKVYEAVVDIKNAQISIKRMEEQLEIASIKQKVAEEAVENARLLFRSGFANYLEVITAQTEALNSALNLVRAKANLLSGRIQLYRALGGGWY